MYCNYCGKSIQDDANICAYCGTRVGGVIARKRLVRPREGRKVAGGCMGMAEYFDIDVTTVRVGGLVTAFMTGVGFIGYLGAWIVRPEEADRLQAQGPSAMMLKFSMTSPAAVRQLFCCIPLPQTTSSSCQFRRCSRRVIG